MRSMPGKRAEKGKKITKTAAYLAHRFRECFLYLAHRFRESLVDDSDLL